MNRQVWIVLFILIWVGTALRWVNLAEIPPGLYHDEAYYGLDAYAVARGAGFPIFFEGNSGREPFFIYLQALVLLLLEPSPFSLRLVAAFIGIVTIPVFFVLVRVLMADSKYSAELALIATAGLVVSYWHMHFSRVGFRAISLPLFICLTFYFFWRARRTNGWRAHILTGIFLGASLYTYLAARLLPLVFAIFWLLELRGILFSTKHTSGFWRWARGAGVISVTALVIALPLLVYFLNHPYAFFLRIDETRIAEVQTLLSNLQHIAAAFYQRGDIEWRHGLARRPLLDWVTALPFTLGLFGALLCWRKPESRLILLWFTIMLLPTILSQQAPNILRAIGAAPAIYVLVAWGFKVSTVAVQRVQWPVRKILLVGAILVLVGSGLMMWRDYFIVWANHKRVFYAFQGDRVALARWVNNQSENIILPIELYAEPTMHFLMLSRFSEVRSPLDLNDEERSRLANEPTMVILPFHRLNGTLVLFRKNQAIFLNPRSDIEDVLRAQPARNLWQDPWGRTAAAIIPIPTQVLEKMLTPPLFVTARAYFDQRLELVGYALDDRRIVPGEPYSVTLYWAARHSMQQEIKIFVHLLDSNGEMVAGVTEYLASGYPMGLLPRGQVIPDRHILTIDPALRPGKYSVEVGVYRPTNDSRLPVQINNADLLDERVIIAPLKVADLQCSTVTPASRVDVRFENLIALVGFDIDTYRIHAGDSFELTLYWKALRPIGRNYTIFVHVFNEVGKMITQADHQPQGGVYPTSIWDADEQVCDRFAVVIPQATLPGKYTVQIGWYDVATGARLLRHDANGQILGDAFVLDTTLE